MKIHAKSLPFFAVAMLPLVIFAQNEPPLPGQKLGYLKSITNPETGSTITRITGDPAELIPNIDARWNQVARHGYSKEAAWNADQSLLLLRTHHGFPAMLFLNGSTYEPEFGRNQSPGTEIRWHPTQPDILFFAKDDQIGFWSAKNDETEIITSFGGYSELHIGPWEGNLSSDGNMVVLSGKHERRQVAFAYDLEKRFKHPDIALTEAGFDWASISASGRYVVINGRIEGERGDQSQVYSLEGKPVGRPWLEYGRPSHYDLTVDTNGDDVAVGVSKSKPDDGRVIKRRLSDGKVTVLTDGGYASHTSTRNLNRPGWAYITYQYRGADWPHYQDEVIAVKLDGSETVERIAHLRSREADYLTQAHACPSPDGKRVIWASAWESESGRPLGAFVAEAREGSPRVEAGQGQE